MRCENLFCIYYENDACTLSEISLSIQGACEACIYVSMDDAVLKRARDALLQKYECEHRNWEAIDALFSSTD